MKSIEYRTGARLLQYLRVCNMSVMVSWVTELRGHLQLLHTCLCFHHIQSVLGYAGVYGVRRGCPGQLHSFLIHRHHCEIQWLPRPTIRIAQFSLRQSECCILRQGHLAHSWQTGQALLAAESKGRTKLSMVFSCSGWHFQSSNEQW